MRKRFQNGSVKKSRDGRYWLGSRREDDGTGHRKQRTRILGKIGRMTKSKADAEMAKIVRPINGRVAVNAPPDITMNDFVERVYFPFSFPSIAGSGNALPRSRGPAVLGTIFWGRSDRERWPR